MWEGGAITDGLYGGDMEVLPGVERKTFARLIGEEEEVKYLVVYTMIRI